MSVDILSDEERERVILVSHLLYDLFTRKRWHRISVRQWINRVVLLYQRPLIVLVYRKCGQWGRRWCRAFHSHRDYAYHEQFERFLATFHTKEKNFQNKLPLFCLTGEHEPNVIRLPGTEDKFGVLLAGLVQISEAERVDRHGPNVTFCLLDPHDPAGRYRKEYALLDAFWAHFLDTPYARHIGVAPRMIRNLKELFRTNTSQDPDTPAPLPDFAGDGLFSDGTDQNAFLDEQIELIRERVVGPIYAGHAGTPLIASGGTPQNMFVYLRYYGPEETRNRTSFSDKDSSHPYPFSLRLMVPDAQEADFRAAFEQLQERAKRLEGGGKWRYIYTADDGEETDKELDEFHDPDGAEWFWARLREEDGIAAFIDTLKGARGQGTRSLADPALASGFLHFRPGIFTQNFPVYISQSEMKKGVKNSPDFQRAVLFHYISTAATAARNENLPPEDKLPLGAMILPLRVGTRTWMAFVHITAMEEQPERQEPGAHCASYHEQALHNLYLFSSVARQEAQRTREFSKREYLGQIEDIFKKLVMDWMDGKHPKRSLSALEALLNERFQWLCRVWPFPQVSIRLKRDKGLDQKEENPQCLPFLEGTGRNHVFLFSLTEVNPFYKHHLYPPVSHSAKEQGRGIHPPRIEDIDKKSLGFLSIREVQDAFKRANVAINDHFRRITDRIEQSYSGALQPGNVTGRG